MTTITVPDDVAARLQVQAAARGVSVEVLIAELSQGLDSTVPAVVTGDDVWDAFIGSSESGDPGWASTDKSVLRRAAAERRR